MPEELSHANQPYNSWTEMLHELTSSYRQLLFAGMAKNTGKTTAFNVFNSIYQTNNLGVTSFGYDGETNDLIFSHPKPAIDVFPSQLVLTAENFLPADFGTYELIDKWGSHPQFGAWQILKIKKHGTLPIAGPSNLPELKEGLKRLQRCGAERIHIDGALNRLSHISLLNCGSILSTGMTAGATINEVLSRTRHQLELFKLPTLTTVELSALNNQDFCVTNNYFLIHNQWYLLPDFLWTHDIKKLLPSKTEALYLRGALTDYFIERLTSADRLPPLLIVNTPAQLLISTQFWARLKNQKIAIRLINKPNLVLVTINPWHPVNADTTDLLVNKLLPICPVPLVDIKKQTIWFNKEVERSDPTLSNP